MREEYGSFQSHGSIGGRTSQRFRPRPSLAMPSCCWFGSPPSWPPTAGSSSWLPWSWAALLSRRLEGLGGFVVPETEDRDHGRRTVSGMRLNAWCLTAAEGFYENPCPPTELGSVRALGIADVERCTSIGVAISGGDDRQHCHGPEQ